MEQEDRYTSENGSHNIAAFVLMMLAILAILSFILAGLRIREIRAGATAEPTLTSPLSRV